MHFSLYILTQTKSMNVDFTTVMATHTNEDLIRIVSVDRSKYQTEAVKAAEREINKRGIGTDRINQLISQFERDVHQELEKTALIPGKGVRFINAVVDTSAIIILYTLLNMLLSDIIFSAEFTIYLILFYITGISYYILLEYKFNQTLGKFLTKTMVVGTSGTRPNFQEIIARTALRMIPYEAFSFLFSNNGMHDRLSHTTVIKKTTSA